MCRDDEGRRLVFCRVMVPVRRRCDGGNINSRQRQLQYTTNVTQKGDGGTVATAEESTEDC